MYSRPIVDPIRRLSIAYHRHVQATLNEQGVEWTPMQLRSLKAIAAFPNCTPQELSVKLDRDKAQITRTLQALERNALIERSQHPTDRRSHVLRLSSAGEKTLRTLQAAEEHTNATMSEGLSPEALDTFRQIATQMADRLSSPTEVSP